MMKNGHESVTETFRDKTFRDKMGTYQPYNFL